MKVIKNFHSHTKYCNHSDLSVYDNIFFHKVNGYKSVGISEHMYIPGYKCTRRLQEKTLDDYIFEVNLAKKEFGIEVLCGLEAEYLIGDREHLIYLKELREKVDYLILANHLIGDLKNNNYLNFVKNVPTPEDLKLNVKLIKEGWATGLFAFIAHPDAVLRNYHWDKHSEDMAHEIGRFAEDEGVILELNVNGFRYGNNRSEEEGKNAYSNLNFWKILSEYNIKTIISGDIHNKKDFSDGYLEECIKVAKNLKLNIIDDFRG